MRQPWARTCIPANCAGTPVFGISGKVGPASSKFAGSPVLHGRFTDSTQVKSSEERKTTSLRNTTAQGKAMFRRRAISGSRLLVTGASQGIGRALAELAARRGGKVLAVARSAD